MEGALDRIISDMEIGRGGVLVELLLGQPLEDTGEGKDNVVDKEEVLFGVPKLRAEETKKTKNII